MPGWHWLQGCLVGRGGEMAEMKGHFDPLARGKFAGVTCVYGEAGVGKSRLMADLISRLPGYQSFTMRTDGVIKKSLGPFTHLLKEYSGLSNITGVTMEKRSSKEEWDRLINTLEGFPTGTGQNL